jgi:hypothetical protein
MKYLIINTGEVLEFKHFVKLKGVVYTYLTKLLIDDNDKYVDVNGNTFRMNTFQGPDGTIPVYDGVNISDQPAGNPVFIPLDLEFKKLYCAGDPTGIIIEENVII